MSMPSGCSTATVPCPAGPAVTSPTIYVTDAKNGEQICDAEVLLVDVKFGDAGQFTGEASIAAATSDAAPYRFDAGGFDGSSRDTISSLPSLSGKCPYSPDFSTNSNEFTVQVSKTGYQTQLVSNVHTTFSVGECEPAPGQVVNVALTPVGR